jgi:hypothetical protein
MRYELPLLPLNGGRRLAGDIVGHAGDAVDFIDDAARAGGSYQA